MEIIGVDCGGCLFVNERIYFISRKLNEGNILLYFFWFILKTYRILLRMFFLKVLIWKRWGGERSLCLFIVKRGYVGSWGIFFLVYCLFSKVGGIFVFF